nr:hypothetical protein Itr_chr08CG08840 [Ipomoea trifida]
MSLNPISIPFFLFPFMGFSLFNNKESCFHELFDFNLWDKIILDGMIYIERERHPYSCHMEYDNVR